MSYQIRKKIFNNSPTLYSVYRINNNGLGWKKGTAEFIQNFMTLDTAKNYIEQLIKVESDHTLISEEVVYDSAS